MCRVFLRISGWFDCRKPPLALALPGNKVSCVLRHHVGVVQTQRTYSLTELARYIDVFYTSSGWFDWTEPTLTTALQEIEGVQSARCTSSMRFRHSEPHRTFSNYILTEIAVKRRHRAASAMPRKPAKASRPSFGRAHVRVWERARVGLGTRLSPKEPRAMRTNLYNDLL